MRSFSSCVLVRADLDTDHRLLTDTLLPGHRDLKGELRASA
jgi:hypothetical protein